MEKNLLLSFLLCAMINLQASDRPLDHRPHVVEFCKTAGLLQDQVDAIAARFRLKNYRNNTVEDIHAHLPDQYKSITETQIRCFLDKVYSDAAFMKELYPSRIILPDFKTRTPKTFAEDRESNYRLDVVEFCKTAGLSQDQVNALAMCFLKTKFSDNTVQKIQENLPNPYKKQLTDTNIRFFLFKVTQSEAFMKQLYPNMKNLDEFKKHVTIEAQTKLPQDKKSNASNKSPNCVDQPRESLFSRTFSAAQSACYGMYQNKRPLAVASVAAAMPYLVQKSGVALPSQATMMLLSAAIFSGKLLTKREFPLIDTTTIVFDQGNSDKKQANIADHIVATGITHADTICATGAAVTGVAACNPHNSWQATAGLALTSGLFAFLGCKARQIHFRFNADWEINWKKIYILRQIILIISRISGLRFVHKMCPPHIRCPQVIICLIMVVIM